MYPMAEELTPDFEVLNCGSLCILTARSLAAKLWQATEIVTPETQWWAGGVVVESRYLQGIIDGIENDGLTVAIE